jgi:hypothetical protein
MKYDVVAGIDEPTLNLLVANIYAQLYPGVLKTTIPVNNAGIASIGIDINVVPTVHLSPVSVNDSRLRAAVHDAAPPPFHALGENQKANLLEMISNATFDVTLPSVVTTINYTEGASSSVITASVSAPVNIQTTSLNNNNYLTVRIVVATFTIPSNPLVQDLLNKAFAPLFVAYLNEHILSNISIPVLQYKSLVVSMPVAVIQAPNAMAYSALGGAQPDVPPPATWPSRTFFAGVDTAALTAAAAVPFPLGPSTGFNWEIISGQAGAQVLAPTGIAINGDGSISATIVAKALAQLTLHTPWPLPNVSFGPEAQATISGTLKPSVVNGELCLLLEGFPIPTFSFDWGIPSWINWLFYPLEAALAAALNAALSPLIGNALQLPPIHVLSLPTFSFTIAGKEITVAISQATTSSQSSLLIVSVQPVIQIKKSASVAAAEAIA